MRILLTIFVILLAALPATAQSKKEMLAKDAELEQRVYTLENRFLTGDPAAERLLRRMDELEAQQRAQQGEIEQLRYERDALRKDVKAMSAKLEAYQAVEDRMKQHLDAVDIAARNAPTPSTDVMPPVQDAFDPPSVASPGQMGSSVMQMSELMTIGQDKLLAGDFGGAQLAFQQYIDLNPAAADIADAYYWLGESYLVRNGFPEASEAYIKSMKTNSQGQYAPRALLGLAGALRGMENTDGACQALDTFAVEYPDVDATVKAKVRTERARAGC